MQLNINFIFIIFFLYSCSLNPSNNIVKTIIDKKETFIIEKKENLLKKEKKTLIKTKDENKKINNNIPIYIIGDSYFLKGVQYFPAENYLYNQTGLADYYGKELHNTKTVNNEFNKVTELLARHKTLPLPSVAKVTNLENGLSVVVRVNDRSKNNTTIIEVSRKTAQLLRFYKTKLARVRVEILSDPSKQLKVVTLSMNNPDFNATIESAPTEEVTVTNLDETISPQDKDKTNYEPPIKLGFEEVIKNNLFIEIKGFKSYHDIKNLTDTLEKSYKITSQKETNNYTLIFGPMYNEEADKLFQILLSKGYKNSEIIIK